MDNMYIYIHIYYVANRRTACGASRSPEGRRERDSQVEKAHFISKFWWHGCNLRTNSRPTHIPKHKTSALIVCLLATPQLHFFRCALRAPPFRCLSSKFSMVLQFVPKLSIRKPVLLLIHTQLLIHSRAFHTHKQLPCIVHQTCNTPRASFLYTP
jgi:hypothetical protein